MASEVYDQLLDFYQANKHRRLGASEWIKFEHAAIYTRVLQYPMPKLVLASIDVDANHRGKGWFKAALEDAKLICKQEGLCLCIENVLNPRLADFLRRENFTEIRELQHFYLPDYEIE